MMMGGLTNDRWSTLDLLGIQSPVLHPTTMMNIIISVNYQSKIAYANVPNPNPPRPLEPSRP